MAEIYVKLTDWPITRIVALRSILTSHPEYDSIKAVLDEVIDRTMESKDYEVERRRTSDYCVNFNMTVVMAHQLYLAATMLRIGDDVSQYVKQSLDYVRVRLSSIVWWIG